MRFAGAVRILNTVGYARMEDPAVLHRRAGNRLLLPAAVTAGPGSLRLSQMALAPLSAAVLRLIAVAIRVTVDSHRSFRTAAAAMPQPRPAPASRWR
ncbi:MAG TPA: hypothetical protein VMR06_13745 [Dokdonella sp.]|uniref:hypothetical protein n=1 Tax=Dokdonella sp. TaxID=2291710 RepID=UPI002B9118EC|nr:hypothetical protein [Dokdonella sp.]HUD43049.1 hypothetical protein [Dokdonella sp.]